MSPTAVHFLCSLLLARKELKHALWDEGFASLLLMSEALISLSNMPLKVPFSVVLTVQMVDPINTCILTGPQSNKKVCSIWKAVFTAVVTSHRDLYFFEKKTWLACKSTTDTLLIDTLLLRSISKTGSIRLCFLQLPYKQQKVRLLFCHKLYLII